MSSHDMSPHGTPPHDTPPDDTPRTVAPRHLSVADAYALWSATYDDMPNPMTALVDAVHAQAFPPLRGKRVVELGCGTGRNLERFLRDGAAEVVGVDSSPAMLQQAARREPRATLLHGDLTKPLPLPLPDGAADVVVFCLTLEHIEDLRLPLREASRITRPGGCVGIIEVHPTLLARGARASFQDAHGQEVQTACHVHTLLSYEYAAEAAGLAVERRQVWTASAARVADIPLIAKYAGEQVLLSLVLRAKPT